jgi:uncharacterized protein (TIGR03067 family)
LTDDLNFSSLRRNLSYGVENQKLVNLLRRETVKTHLLVALAVGLLIAADEGKNVATKERKRLEGTWTITSVVRNDNPLPEDRLKDAQFVFQGERFAQKQGDKTLAKGTFRLDPGKRPPTIDLTMSEGEERDKTILSIYQLEDDVLRICGAGPGHERPTEFAAKDGSGHTLITCKRAKP